MTQMHSSFSDGELMREYREHEAKYNELQQELYVTRNSDAPFALDEARAIEREIDFHIGQMGHLVQVLRGRGYTEFPTSKLKS